MNFTETKEKYRKIWEEINANIDTECTCNQCYDSNDEEVNCAFAFDIYNTNGDCLASK